MTNKLDNHDKDGLDRLLDSFETVTLQEMNNVKLMDRVETKYVMSSSQLISVLEKLSDNYRLLMVEDNKKNHYLTLYFDTANLDIYNMHHNGRANRYKIRIREYADTGISFVEIKFKDNKKKVAKKRIELDGAGVDSDSLCPLSRKFIDEKSIFDSGELRPVLRNSYYRMTFVHKDSVERVTIDFNLEFFGENGEYVSFDNLVIAEVKQEKSAQKSDFVRLMQEMGIRPRRFSKYCMGVSFLYDGVKKNNFKENMIFVNKIKEGMVV